MSVIVGKISSHNENLTPIAPYRSINQTAVLKIAKIESGNIPERKQLSRRRILSFKIIPYG
jgi:hypothetical protein